jgi:hypothetical protein
MMFRFEKISEAIIKSMLSLTWNAIWLASWTIYKHYRLQRRLFKIPFHFTQESEGMHYHPNSAAFPTILHQCYHSYFVTSIFLAIFKSYLSNYIKVKIKLTWKVKITDIPILIWSEHIVYMHWNATWHSVNMYNYYVSIKNTYNKK